MDTNGSSNELQNASGVSSDVDIALGYTSEKLANIENLLLHMTAGGKDMRAVDVEIDDISADSIEKAFTFDLLYALLNCELTELDKFLTTDLQDQTIDALRKISSIGQSTEVLVQLVNKLHRSEELLKQSQERILEIKLQLAKLKVASFSSHQHEWRSGLAMDVKEDLGSTEWKPQVQTIEERHTLRMLEKSLSRELELENKLMGHKQNQEDLKQKIRLVEQVAIFMEEAAEVAWGRFLEAENTCEVLMGMSKEMLARYSNLSSSTNQKDEISHKLQVCINQLNEKEATICTLNGRIAELMTDNAYITHLRDNIQMLEENIKTTESRLHEANASNETSQEQLKEMKLEMEALRNNLDVAEKRAETAEENASHLIDTNLELTEELDFIKGSNDSNARKVSELEKQARELDIQLQHAKVSSEASQEQQHMLYMAIWDMETLIDELKQKVAQSESAEERCNSLLETNLKMKKELELLRSEVEFTRGSLNQATVDKKSGAEDIRISASLIMDMVMQLALERERIQKQLVLVTKECKLLRERTLASVVILENKRSDEKDFLISEVEKSPEDTSSDDHQTRSKSSTEDATMPAQQIHTDQQLHNTGKCRGTFVSMAILVVLLSILAAHLFQRKIY